MRKKNVETLIDDLSSKRQLLSVWNLEIEMNWFEGIWGERETKLGEIVYGHSSFKI